MNNKGQTGGLITGLVFGVASLIIGIIVAFVIVSTLGDAGLLTSGRTSATTTNETDGYLNTTGYTLSDFNSATTTAISITNAWNVTVPASPILLLAANYTLDTDTGIVSNATTTTYPDVNFTYSVTTESSEESSSDSLRGNFTEGVDNVSSKIPTVLLIAAIVLILGVLAILVGVWQRMRMGGGETL